MLFRNLICMMNYSRISSEWKKGGIAGCLCETGNCEGSFCSFTVGVYIIKEVGDELLTGAFATREIMKVFSYNIHRTSVKFSSNSLIFSILVDNELLSEMISLMRVVNISEFAWLTNPALKKPSCFLSNSMRILTFLIKDWDPEFTVTYYENGYAFEDMMIMHFIFFSVSIRRI